MKENLWEIHQLRRINRVKVRRSLFRPFNSHHRQFYLLVWLPHIYLRWLDCSLFILYPPSHTLPPPTPILHISIIESVSLSTLENESIFSDYFCFPIFYCFLLFVYFFSFRGVDRLYVVWILKRIPFLYFSSVSVCTQNKRTMKGKIEI